MKQKLVRLFDEKMWKFLLVGILNTLVGNGLSFLLLNLVPWEAFSLGSKAALSLSSGISTVLASIMSYFLNKHYTFQYKGKDRGVIFRFALNIAVCYFIAYTLMGNLCIEILSSQSDWIRENVSMVVGMCSFVACNYIGQRFFAFREKKEHTE